MFVHLSANLYAGNKTPSKMLAALRAAKFDGASISEGYRYIEDLTKLSGYRITWGKGAKDTRRGAKDTPVLVRSRFVGLGEGAMKISDPSVPLKIAPERWGTFSCVRAMSLDMAVVAWHPHAGVDNLPRTVDRVEKYARSVNQMDRILTMLDKMGYAVIIGGDINWHEKQVAPWSPYKMFAKHGYAVRTVGVDAVAWNPKFLVLDDFDEIPQSKTGSDHVWLRATFDNA